MWEGPAPGGRAAALMARRKRSCKASGFAGRLRASVSPGRPDRFAGPDEMPGIMIALLAEQSRETPLQPPFAVCAQRPDHCWRTLERDPAGVSRDRVQGFGQGRVVGAALDADEIEILG